MYRGKWITLLAGIAVLANVSAVQAQAVAFVEINDAVRGRFFDAVTSLARGNKLIIGLSTGRDPATFKANNFRASTAASSHLSAADTISFKIRASSGFYISKITYVQKGSGSVLRTGRASGIATWVVGNFAYNLGTFGSNPSLTRSLDLRHLRWTSVPVSITTALFAFSTPQLGSATVSITSAEVLVEVAPIGS